MNIGKENNISLTLENEFFKKRKIHFSKKTLSSIKNRSFLLFNKEMVSTILQKHVKIEVEKKFQRAKPWAT